MNFEKTWKLNREQEVFIYIVYYDLAVIIVVQMSLV